MTEAATNNIIEFSKLDENKSHSFVLSWTPEQLSAFAADLGIRDIPKFTAKMTLKQNNPREWQVDGTIGATVIQACVVSDEDVKTRIDQGFSRRLMADLTGYEAETRSETELDENIDVLEETLDLDALALETLALYLPDYPRKPDLEPVSVSARPEGTEPLEGDAAKPFASLAQLKDKLEKNS